MLLNQNYSPAELANFLQAKDRLQKTGLSSNLKIAK